MLSAVSSSEEYDVGSDVDSSEDELKREDFVPPAFERSCKRGKILSHLPKKILSRPPLKSKMKKIFIVNEKQNSV